MAKGKKRVGLWILLVGIALVLVLFGIVPIFSAPTPESCKSCHEMQAYYQSWRNSVHGQAGINCTQCHVRPRFLPSFLYRISLYGDIFSRLFNIKVEPLALGHATTEACQQCHTLNRTTSTSGDLKINHRLHVTKAKIGCPDCHSGSVHPEVGKLGKLNPDTRKCLTCHKKQIEKCNYCHNTSQEGSEDFKH